MVWRLLPFGRVKGVMELKTSSRFAVFRVIHYGHMEVNTATGTAKLPMMAR